MYAYGYRYNSGLVVGAGGGAPFANTYSLDFDGVDDYVGVFKSFDFGANDFSFSAWFKRENLIPTNDVLFFSRKSTTTPNWQIRCDNYDIQIEFNTGGFWTSVKTTTQPIAKDTDWHNIVVTKTGINAYIFIDGVAQSTSGTAPSVLDNGDGFSTIGARVGATQYWEGSIDEVSIFDYIISIGDVWDGSGTPTDLSLLATPPLSWYRMGDNGAWKSPQWLLPSNENKDKVSNYSLSFDGVDDKIELSTQSLGITGAISVSAWVKIPTSNTGGGGTNIQEFVCEDRTSGTNRNWALNWRGGGLNRISGIIFDGGGSAVSATTNAIVPNDGNWHHLMFTYTGDTSTDGLKLFVDGIQRAQATSANGGLRSTTAVVPTIGGLSQVIQWMFEGNIDEVAIFNTDQSSNVSTIYNSGTPTTISGAVAHYKMGEEATFSGGVWTVPDQVGSNDGTSNAMTIEDRVGKAPNSSNNALSYNMDEVDRVTDTP